MRNHGDDASCVLAWLPDGAQVLSTLVLEHVIPRHVYRVVSDSGTILGEFATLVELGMYVSQATWSAPD